MLSCSRRVCGGSETSWRKAGWRERRTAASAARTGGGLWWWSVEATFRASCALRYTSPCSCCSRRGDTCRARRVNRWCLQVHARGRYLHYKRGEHEDAVREEVHSL